MVVVLCLFLTALDFCECWAGESEQVGGVIQGHFVWADNTPVTNCRVKLVDKIDVFSVINPEGLPVQQISISRDAQVREVNVDAEGRFRFTKLPVGKYYFYFKSPDVFEGEDWLYQYTKHAFELYFMGHMYKPDEYKVNEGVTINIPDIELIRLIVPNNPIAILGKSGVFEFQWSKHNEGKFSRITIRHQEYTGSLKHSSYASNEVKGNVYQVPSEKPLYPGKHCFMVEILTPTLREFAKSNWIDFVVPGDVLFLRVNEDKIDPTGRTINWFGSDVIKSVRISVEDGSFTLFTSKHSVKLPSVTTRRQLYFHALDTNGNELIPGWTVFFTQWKTKSDKK